MDAEQRRLAQAGLAFVDERDITCCYARQDKFWVQGAPDGERWEIYTVLEDSPTFWGRDGGGSWAVAEASQCQRVANLLDELTTTQGAPDQPG